MTSLVRTLEPARLLDADLTINRSLESRQCAYENTLGDVLRYESPISSLLPYVQHEEHPRLVTTAVRDYIRHHPCDVTNEMQPIAVLRKVLLSPDTLNRGAVLAGMVQLGDRRINAVTRPVRTAFKPADIRSFSRIHETSMKSETVYYYLDWLSELANMSVPDCVISDLSCGLMLMVLHDEYRLVEEPLESLGFSADEVAPRVPFAGFLSRVMPMFESLSERLDPHHMNQVIRLWQRHREIRYSA